MLTVSDAHKRFGQVQALDGCSFSVDRGRMLGFLGPNGAGKTTAMRAIFVSFSSHQLELVGCRTIWAMSRYLHTMLRITDPERSRAFYEALGFEFRREFDIVRNGELEATNYFFGFPGQDEELELTFNHDGRSYELGTAYGHVAIGVDDLDETLAQLARQGIEPERPPYTVRDGGSRLCFVKDPTDSYRVEIVEH
jgi:lactoylglutathione lyase